MVWKLAQSIYTFIQSYMEKTMMKLSRDIDNDLRLAVAVNKVIHVTTKAGSTARSLGLLHG